MAASEQVADVVQIFGADGAALLVVGGEIDVASVEKLRSALASIPEVPAPHIVVDVKNVGFIGLCGLEAIAGAAARVQPNGGTLKLLAPSPFLRRVLKILRLDGLAVASDVPFGRGA